MRVIRSGIRRLVIVGFCAWIGAHIVNVRTPQGANAQPASSPECPPAADFVEPTYGGKIRRLANPDGHTHNIYYHRNPWNADNTSLIGIRKDQQHRNWVVALYSGDGCYIKDLFAIQKFDWRLVWDRNDPDILYTWNRSELYRYHVTTGRAEVLKSFSPLGLKPTGPSLNQGGDRILVITSDDTYHSYHLPDMQDERSFRVAYPPNCPPSWKDERYIGYRNYIATSCSAGDGVTQALLIYDDMGVAFHVFDGMGGGGHYDFSPDGRLGYFRMWRSGTPLEIYVVNLDGTEKRVLYSVPQGQARFVQNLHVSWPDKVKDWFIVSFFPSPANLPPRYNVPLDEIMLVHTSGRHKYLARTETVPGQREQFWAQPLGSPSADGSRVNFNSNRSGRIEQCILWMPPDPLQGTTR